jgi:hypothetical protein
VTILNNLDDTRARVGRPLGAKPPKAERSRGQILILFVMAIFVFTGMVALVIDVSWYWVNSLRVQRAADAAALAGVVQLPTNPTNPTTGAFALAKAEATKNGYTHGAGSVVIVSIQEPAVTGRRLHVTVTAPVNMFFMRIFGINQIMATRSARAEFVLPVPMGSPDNWYGVFGSTRGLTSTTTSDVHTPSTRDSGWTVATVAPVTTPAGWTANSSSTLVDAVNSDNSRYARTTTNLSAQRWSTFGLYNVLAANQTVTAIRGIQVRLTDAIKTENNCSTAKFQVALSYDGAASTPHWTTSIAANLTPNLTTSNQQFTLGATNSLAAWPLASPTHAWAVADLNDTNFRLRLTANKSGGTCPSTNEFRLDILEVRVTYDIDTVTQQTNTVNVTNKNLQGPGAPCTTLVVGCYEATGQTLNPNGFWGTMNSEGAEDSHGDAYQAYYETAGGTTNPSYDTQHFYNYAVEMPKNSTGGSVYVYDPVFCATQNDKGTGDRWFNDDGDQVSSYFELYNTQGTLDDITDDGPALANSAAKFRGSRASDTTMGGPSVGTPCNYKTDVPYGDGRDFHDRWYLLASGLIGGPTGTIYRVHTTTTDPTNVGAERGTFAENSFALFVGATSGTPRLYGIGAMQAFTPLSATGSQVQSEFYLAQIDAVHAGKTVQIKLWDAGDTRPLSAELRILVPTSTGWAPTNIDWTAAKGTTNAGAAACTTSGNDVGFVQTNVGNTTGTFNGCWLTIEIPIPGNYTAPQSGWWKIRYTMNGSGTSDDVTTWTVAIKGNPVHLIVP